MATWKTPAASRIIQARCTPLRGGVRMAGPVFRSRLQLGGRRLVPTRNRFPDPTVFKTVPGAGRDRLPKSWSVWRASNPRPPVPKTGALPGCATHGWCRLQASNPRPSVYKTAALPTELNRQENWWRWTGSNRRPSACKAIALPTELHPHKLWLPEVGSNHRHPD